MWTVEVPGPKPVSGNPSWRRLQRLPETMPEGDVLDFLKETVVIHGCARATRGGVEVSVYRARVTIVRYLSPPESP